MTISPISRKTVETKIHQSIAAFKNNLQTRSRTGRANPALLDSIQVEYYGSMVPLSRWPTSLARLAHHQRPARGKRAWRQDRKAIRESDLDLNPASMGELIRVPMPPMSEERRKEMTKLVRNEGESAKIAIRKPAPRRQSSAGHKRSWSGKPALAPLRRRPKDRAEAATLPEGRGPDYCRSILGRGKEQGKSWRSELPLLELADR